MSGDERILHVWSLAKYPTAFFSMSHSVLTLAQLRDLLLLRALEWLGLHTFVPAIAVKRLGPGPSPAQMRYVDAALLNQPRRLALEFVLFRVIASLSKHDHAIRSVRRDGASPRLT